MADPLKVAKAELADLDTQIKRLQARRQEVSITVGVLEGYKKQRAVQSVEFALQAPTASKRSKKNRIVVAEAASQILSDGKARPSAAIVEELEKREVPIAGKNKVAYVAQILSREKAKFLPNRKSGWTLRTLGTVVPIGKTA
jgi:hypothetical protein